MSVAVPLTAQPPEPAQTQAQRNAPAQAPEKPSADKPAAEKPSAEKPSAVPAETAQPQVSEKPPAAAEATQPPAHDSVPAQPAETSENGRPRAAETPFAEVFSQLAGRLVGVVVNVSTQMAPQPKGPQDAPQPSPSSPATPGTPLDEFFRDFFGEKGAPGGSGGPRAASLGSGFIVDPSGLIVTNNHVIANAEQITVTLSDDTTMQAQVIGRDAVTDLALLKIEPKTPLPAATWGDSAKAKVGDWVLAIGNPFGLGGSVTAGIISATARDIHSGPYDDYLQTDASINRGNSGGPMFNLAGEVIGINTAIYSPAGGSIGIGFAIPAALAQPIIEQLKTTGKVERGWIGARIQPVTDEIAESLGLDKSHGAMIAAVDGGSPAEKAKLQPGDVILSYDGKPIDRSRQLPRLVADTPPDKQVKVTIWRDGKEREADLKVVALNPNRPAPPPPEPEKPKPPPSVDALGLKLAKLTPELRKQFSLSDGVKGAVVIEVPRSGPAAAQGLRAGDVVVAVGRSAVANPEDVPQLVNSAKKNGRRNVLVRVEREGNTRFVALPIETG
ncbi:MAG: Do family serine endopeptidase [Alphaproteobacteria bacterium]|nr:Do family serine endopeptidase [Alphaproteobacteria bacterium]MBV9583716.1 Do family serine endopeptidase [Alphaproteobacteria bacterium]